MRRRSDRNSERRKRSCREVKVMIIKVRVSVWLMMAREGALTFMSVCRLKRTQLKTGKMKPVQPIISSTAM